MATKTRASRLAAEAKTGSDSDVVPLGQRVVGSNDGTLTVSLPKETAERVGIEVGDAIEIGYDGIGFRLQEADRFDGW